MSRVEVTISDRLDGDIDRLVDDGEFMSREKAMEELLTLGLSAYDTGDRTDEPDEMAYTNTGMDQEDPAKRDDPDDEYTF